MYRSGDLLNKYLFSWFILISKCGHLILSNNKTNTFPQKLYKEQLKNYIIAKLLNMITFEIIGNLTYLSSVTLKKVNSISCYLKEWL